MNPTYTFHLRRFPRFLHFSRSFPMRLNTEVTKIGMYCALATSICALLSCGKAPDAPKDPFLVSAHNLLATLPTLEEIDTTTEMQKTVLLSESWMLRKVNAETKQNLLISYDETSGTLFVIASAETRYQDIRGELSSAAAECGSVSCVAFMGQNPDAELVYITYHFPWRLGEPWSKLFFDTHLPVGIEPPIVQGVFTLVLEEKGISVDDGPLLPYTALTDTLEGYSQSKALVKLQPKPYVPYEQFMYVMEVLAVHFHGRYVPSL